MSQGPVDDQPPATPRRQPNIGPLMVGLFPLGCWPFVLVPNLMSLAGSEGSEGPPGRFVMAVAMGFLWGSTLYPLVYAAALVVTLVLAFVADRPAAASGVAWVPLAYALAVFGCLLAWMVAGG